MSKLARAAVRRLRAGVVPEWELENLSVGYDRARKAVADALSMLRAGQKLKPKPLFVRGEWGTGKSHFLAFLRAAASSLGIPNTVVNLNARSAALNYPQRFFGELAEQVRGNGSTEGLKGALIEIMSSDSTRARLASFAQTSAAADLGYGLRSLCWAYERGDRLELDEHSAWLRIHGADLAWADYGYKREQAIARIESLGRMFRETGLHGLVIIFDEAETIDQLWNVKSRLSAYTVMGRLCESDAVWPVFGITERFERTIAADCARGISRSESGISAAARSFLRSWQQSEFLILQPPPVGSLTARALGDAVERLYRRAFPACPIDRQTLPRCLEEWNRNPRRNPRSLIRLIIHRLDAGRPL